MQAHRTACCACPYDATRMKMMDLTPEQKECPECSGFGKRRIEGAFFPPFEEECDKCDWKGWTNS